MSAQISQMVHGVESVEIGKPVTVKNDDLLGHREYETQDIYINLADGTGIQIVLFSDESKRIEVI